MVISRGPGWVVIGATLVVVDVVVVVVVVEISGTIKASTPTRILLVTTCNQKTGAE
jgi:hypothetical protein